jgi:hypothetical protein
VKVGKAVLNVHDRVSHENADMFFFARRACQMVVVVFSLRIFYPLLIRQLKLHLDVLPSYLHRHAPEFPGLVFPSADRLDNLIG